MYYEEGLWTTKDGRDLKIEDMETEHIENTIKFLEKNPTFYDKCYGEYWDIDSFDYEDNSELVNKKIEELKTELNKRKGLIYYPFPNNNNLNIQDLRHYMNILYDQNVNILEKLSNLENKLDEMEG